MFCCMLLYVHSSIAIILRGKRELVALLNLSSWCLVMVEQLFLAVPWGCLRFVIVVFSDHTHRLRAKKGPAPPPPPPPPLGNFADISYLEENFKPHLLRDVCTLCSGALVSGSLLHMLL